MKTIKSDGALDSLKTKPHKPDVSAEISDRQRDWLVRLVIKTNSIHKSAKKLGICYSKAIFIY